MFVTFPWYCKLHYIRNTTHFHRLHIPVYRKYTKTNPYGFNCVELLKFVFVALTINESTEEKKILRWIVLLFLCCMKALNLASIESKINSLCSMWHKLLLHITISTTNERNNIPKMLPYVPHTSTFTPNSKEFSARWQFFYFQLIYSMPRYYFSVRWYSNKGIR